MEELERGVVEPGQLKAIMPFGYRARDQRAPYLGDRPLVPVVQERLATPTKERFADPLLCEPYSGIVRPNLVEAVLLIVCGRVKELRDDVRIPEFLISEAERADHGTSRDGAA